MTSFTLRNARLRGREGCWDMVVVADRVAEIAAAGTAVAVGAEYAIGGRLLLPGLVDPHVHLDKAFQLPYLPSGGSLDLGSALRSSAALRGRLSLDTVAANAERVLAMMAAGGTVAARVHVEITADSDAAVVRLHRDLADAHPEVALELAAFAQYGTTASPVMMSRMERALAEGCTVVAGCPYADPDPLQHLDEVIALALEHGVPLDLHLDLSDRPEDLLLGEVIPRVEKAGLEGRVAIGHATTLTALAPARVRELAAAVASAGIAVVAIPTTDLFLSGREQASAHTRGVTRILELIQAGVPVALASNNYENAFTPVSMPSLTHAAWLASLTNYMGSERQQLELLDAITTAGRRILEIEVPGVDVGDVVGACVFDVAEPVDVVRSAAHPRAVVVAGRGLVTADRSGTGELAHGSER